MARYLLILTLLAVLTICSTSVGLAADFSELGLEVGPTPPLESILLLNLPRVYVLPDSPLYFLISFWQQTRLFLSLSPEQRQVQLMRLAEYKLAESMALLKRGKDDPQVVLDTLRRYQDYWNQALVLLDQTKAEARLDLPAVPVEKMLIQQRLLLRFIEGANPDLAREVGDVLGVSRQLWMEAAGQGLEIETYHSGGYPLSPGKLPLDRRY